MTGAYERVTSLAELFARVGELAVKTLVFDIEPLVSPWNGGQQGLDRGVAEIVDQAGAVWTALCRTGETHGDAHAVATHGGSHLQVAVGAHRRDHPGASQGR